MNFKESKIKVTQFINQDFYKRKLEHSSTNALELFDLINLLFGGVWRSLFLFIPSLPHLFVQFLSIDHEVSGLNTYFTSTELKLYVRTFLILTKDWRLPFFYSWLKLLELGSLANLEVMIGVVIVNKSKETLTINFFAITNPSSVGHFSSLTLPH